MVREGSASVMCQCREGSRAWTTPVKGQARVTERDDHLSGQKAARGSGHRARLGGKKVVDDM